MKILKSLTSLFIGGLLFFNALSSTVLAKEDTTSVDLTSNSIGTLNISALNYDISDGLSKSKLNNFKDEESVKALERLKSELTGYKETNIYVRSIKDTNTGEITTDPNYYTLDQMNNIEMIQAKNFPISKENSWMRLTMDVYKTSNGQYEFYLFYDWKTKPFFTMDDMIAIGHDSNLSFDTSTARSFHEQVIINPSTGNSSESNVSLDSSNSSKCKSSINGVGFKFNLPSSPDTWPAYYQGYMTVKGQFTNPNITSGSMEICYSHQQLSFSYNIQDALDFLTSGSVKIKLTGSHDEFKYGDAFER